MANKVLDSVGLSYFWGKIKAAFASKVPYATEGGIAILDSEGNIDDSGYTPEDFVHNTGNETISGTKTFNDGIDIDNGHSLVFKNLVNGNDYGPYVQGGYDTTNQEPTLSFYGSYGDEAVRLINIEDPRNNNDAANKSYVDNALQSYTETDPTVPSWAKASTKPSYDYSEISHTPENVSTFTNDAGYLTSSDVVTIYSGSAAPSSSFGSNGDIYIQTS